jgi:cyanate lyase
MNYSKLSQEALEASNNKGFTFKSVEQSLALAICEVCEAIEADRSNKRANYKGFTE